MQTNIKYFAKIQLISDNSLSLQLKLFEYSRIDALFAATNYGFACGSE